MLNLTKPDTWGVEYTPQTWKDENTRKLDAKQISLEPMLTVDNQLVQ